MRITFLNSCLEPGKDGIGDYTRQLAEECQSVGSSAVLIALNDHYCQEPVTGAATSGAAEIPYLRLPATMSWDRRVQLALDFRMRHQPDCYSLQLSPYAFQPKGIVCGLHLRLTALVRGLPLHIMFHELWIGAMDGASLKDRVVGDIQRRCLLRMNQRLQPQAVSTSNVTYQTMLARNGVMASVLPLFNNLPLSPIAEAGNVEAKLAVAGVPADLLDPDQTRLGVFFGSLPGTWPPVPLLPRLHTWARQAGRRLVLISVGRIDKGGEDLWSRLSTGSAGDLVFVRLGLQSADIISLLLQTAHFGIATAPLQLIGKSSAAATMLAHGLPVIVNRDDWHLRGYVPENCLHDDRLLLVDDNLEGKLSDAITRKILRNPLRTVALQLLNLLQPPS